MSKLLEKRLKGVINSMNDQFISPVAPQMTTGFQNCSPVKNASVFVTNSQPYQNPCNVYQPQPTIYNGQPYQNPCNVYQPQPTIYNGQPYQNPCNVYQRQPTIYNGQPYQNPCNVYQPQPTIYNGQPYQNPCNVYQPQPTTTYIQAPVPNAAPPCPYLPLHPYPPPAHPTSYSYPAVQNSYTPPEPVAAVRTKAVSPPAVVPPVSRQCSQACVPATKAPEAGKQGKGEAAEGEENGNELLSISSGVQLFIVDAKGQVSSPSSPGYLRIIIIFSNQQGDSTDENPLVLLDVWDLLCPLTKDTPVLLASSGIFMLPHSEIPGSLVGIVLSSQLPADKHQCFQDILSQLVNLQIQSPDDNEEESINLNAKVSLASCNEDQKNGNSQRPKWSQKMGNAILSGSTKFSEGFAKTAKSTSTSIHKQGAKIRGNIKPEETPTKISPHVTQGLNAVKTTSRGVLQVSRFLDDGKTAVAGQAGKVLAPQIKKHGPKLIPKSMKESRDGRASKADGAKFVAVSSVKGFSAVWTNLKTGARDVCKSVATETVATVEYKYGEDAGQATDTALKSVGNVGLAAYNFNRLTIGSLMLSTAMSTAENMDD